MHKNSADYDIAVDEGQRSPQMTSIQRPKINNLF